MDDLTCMVDPWISYSKSIIRSAAVTSERSVPDMHAVSVETEKVTRIIGPYFMVLCFLPKLRKPALCAFIYMKFQETHAVA